MKLISPKAPHAGSSKGFVRKSLTLLLWLLPLGFLSLFYFYPLASILALSFGRGFSIFQPFAQVLINDSLRGIFWFTLWQAALSTLDRKSVV